MIELIRSAAFNRQPQPNSRRCAKPQPQRPRRPRRASRSFLVTRLHVLPLRPVVTGCGTRPITILSISRPTRLRVPNNNPTKTTGSIAVVCAIITMPLRRQRGPRSCERGSQVDCYQFSVIRARDHRTEVSLRPIGPTPRWVVRSLSSPNNF